jgi:dienelactone hydrolase
VLCLHQTVAIGKAEPAGLGGNANLRYAQELAERGYVTLAPDYPNFGEYRCDPYARGYASGSMKAIWNNIRAVDLLQGLPEVDAGRIGCIGHSLGGHNAMFTAVFDRRLKAIVSSCGFTAFARYYGGDLAGWTGPAYMPRIKAIGRPEKMPFDFHEVVAALAPRAFFANAPLRDANFDNEGVREVMRAAADVYRLLGVPERLDAVYPDTGHDFPPAQREQAYRFLDRWLSEGTGKAP